MQLLPRDPVRRAAVLLAFLSAASVYFMHTYSYAPRKERRLELEARLQDLKDPELKGESAGDPSRPELERDMADSLDLLERLEVLIPPRDRIPALLEAIAAEAHRWAVEMTVLRPEPPESDGPYERWSYQLAVRGGYHAIGAFTAAIGSLDYIILTDDMVISAETGLHARQGPGPVPVVASLRIRIRVAVPTDTIHPGSGDGM